MRYRKLLGRRLTGVDQSIRKLERAGATGDPLERARALVARARTDPDFAVVLRLAACLGHPAITPQAKIVLAPWPYSTPEDALVLGEAFLEITGSTDQVRRLVRRLLYVVADLILYDLTQNNVGRIKGAHLIFSFVLSDRQRKQATVDGLLRVLRYSLEEKYVMRGRLVLAETLLRDGRLT